MEVLVVVALGVLAFIVIGSIVLHVLVGLLLLPFQIGFALVKGVFATLFLLPVVLIVLALGLCSLVVLGAVGSACFLLAHLF